MTVKLTHRGPISIVSFEAPPLNLMTIEIMDRLIAAHQEADARPETRVILTVSGTPGIFSNGLDPGYVLGFEPERRLEIFRGVGRMLHNLFALSKPHICKISGPAMAGGAILAITADFRAFDAKHGRLSFAEPKVGLPIPGAVVRVISHFCQPKMLRQVVMLGKNMDGEDALAAGIADIVAETEALDGEIGKLAERICRLSPAVMAATKRDMRGELLELTRPFAEGQPGLERFMGEDFLGEGLRALVEKRFPNFPH